MEITIEHKKDIETEIKLVKQNFKNSIRYSADIKIIKKKENGLRSVVIIKNL